MSQFNTTYQGRKIVVNYAWASDPYESLDGVEIYDCATGEQIDVDNLPDDDYGRIHYEVWGEFQAWQADSALGWR